MKTVKINQKSKFLFFVFILILSMICVVTLAIGQSNSSLKQFESEIDSSYISQPYGDTALVDMNFRIRGGKLIIEVVPDEDLKEVILFTYVGNEIKYLSVDTFDSTAVTLANLGEGGDLYIRTKRGVSGINYVEVTEKGRRSGYITMNGRLIAKYTNKTITKKIGSTPADFFKDVVEWRYEDSAATVANR